MTRAEGHPLQLLLSAPGWKTTAAPREGDGLEKESLRKLLAINHREDPESKETYFATVFQKIAIIILIFN